eukprot:scaffold109935_cov32-Tisochrysis_lutea.AAC.2
MDGATRAATRTRPRESRHHRSPPPGVVAGRTNAWHDVGSWARVQDIHCYCGLAGGLGFSKSARSGCRVGPGRHAHQLPFEEQECEQLQDCWRLEPREEQRCGIVASWQLCW